MGTKKIFEHAKNMKWFDIEFDNITNKEIFGYKTSMTKNPCGYNKR